jgi:hypothetical protein
MGNPLLSEWVLSRSSPAERRLSALQPRRLACRRSGSSVRPAPRHPLQLQRVETPLRPRRLGCAAFRSARVPLGATRYRFKTDCKEFEQ